MFLALGYGPFVFLAVDEIVIRDDPLTLWISLAAVLIAIGGFTFAVSQGLAIRRIETREHDWQSADRLSAHLQVTRLSKLESTIDPGFEMSQYVEWIRVRNTGLAIAEDIDLTIADDGGESIYVTPEAGAVTQLHPGEHFNFYLSLTMSTPPMGVVSLSWNDGRPARNTKESRINL